MSWYYTGLIFSPNASSNGTPSVERSGHLCFMTTEIQSYNLLKLPFFAQLLFNRKTKQNSKVHLTRNQLVYGMCHHLAMFKAEYYLLHTKFISFPWLQNCCFLSKNVEGHLKHGHLNLKNVCSRHWGKILLSWMPFSNDSHINLVMFCSCCSSKVQCCCEMLCLLCFLAVLDNGTNQQLNPQVDQLITRQLISLVLYWRWNCSMWGIDRYAF